MTNLFVVARIRPPFPDELGSAAVECVTVRSNHLLLTDLKDCSSPLVADNRQRRRLFQFDHIFSENPETDDSRVQSEIYDCLGKKALESMLDGYNSSLFAYGMTGTGKTYTIFGTKAVLDHVQQNTGEGNTFEQHISIIEIYNERIRDLLADTGNSKKRKELRVREHPDTGPYVEGLTKVPIMDFGEIDSVITRGIVNRRTAENGVHKRSSRSHVMCTIYYHEVTTSEQYSREFDSKISLIDLAGSEKTQNFIDRDRFHEGRHINLSLSSLSTVISRLAEKSQRELAEQEATISSQSTINSSLRSSRQSALSSGTPVHVPYRNSKLTWLLSDSLGGNARTTMIAIDRIMQNRCTSPNPIGMGYHGDDSNPYSTLESMVGGSHNRISKVHMMSRGRTIPSDSCTVDALSSFDTAQFEGTPKQELSRITQTFSSMFEQTTELTESVSVKRENNIDGYKENHEDAENGEPSIIIHPVASQLDNDATDEQRKCSSDMSQSLIPTCPNEINNQIPRKTCSKMFSRFRRLWKHRNSPAFPKQQSRLYSIQRTRPKIEQRKWTRSLIIGIPCLLSCNTNATIPKTTTPSNSPPETSAGLVVKVTSERIESDLPPVSTKQFKQPQDEVNFTSPSSTDFSVSDCHHDLDEVQNGRIISDPSCLSSSSFSVDELDCLSSETSPRLWMRHGSRKWMVYTQRLRDELTSPEFEDSLNLERARDPNSNGDTTNNVDVERENSRNESQSHPDQAKEYNIIQKTVSTDCLIKENMYDTEINPSVVNTPCRCDNVLGKVSSNADSTPFEVNSNPQHHASCVDIEQYSIHQDITLSSTDNILSKTIPMSHVSTLSTNVASIHDSSSVLEKNPMHDIDSEDHAAAAAASAVVSQFKYIHGLLTKKSQSQADLQMAMPSLKALLHDASLETDDQLTTKLYALVGRIQRTAHHSPRTKLFHLTHDERETLKKSLQTADLLIQCVSESSTVSDELESSWFTRNPMAVPFAREQIADAMHAIKGVSKSRKLEKCNYQQMREKIVNLITEDQSELLLVTPLVQLEAPASLSEDLEEMITNMDTKCHGEDVMRMSSDLRATLVDLASRLDPLLVGFQRNQLEAGLEIMYEAIQAQNCLPSQHLLLTKSASLVILRSLELANREKKINPLLQYGTKNQPNDLWDLSLRLEHRLSDELSSTTIGECSTMLSVINLKEAMLIQHILLAVLAAHGSDRTDEEKAKDELFFRMCSGHNTDASSTVTSAVSMSSKTRFTELLSPITEVHSPDSSTHESDKTGRDSMMSDPASPVESTSTNWWNTPEIFVTTKATSEKENVRSENTEGIKSLDMEAGGPTIEFETPTNDALKMEKSLAESMVTYLRTRTLVNDTVMTSGEASVLSLKKLHNRFDAALAQGSMSDFVSISVEDFNTVQSVLLKDDTSHSRILNRCLIQSIQKCTAIQNSKSPVADGGQKTTSVVGMNQDLVSHMKQVDETCPEQIDHHLKRDIDVSSASEPQRSREEDDPIPQLNIIPTMEIKVEHSVENNGETPLIENQQKNSLPVTNVFLAMQQVKSVINDGVESDIPPEKDLLEALSVLEARYPSSMIELIDMIGQCKGPVRAESINRLVQQLEQSTAYIKDRRNVLSRLMTFTQGQHNQVLQEPTECILDSLCVGLLLAPCERSGVTEKHDKADVVKLIQRLAENCSSNKNNEPIHLTLTEQSAIIRLADALGPAVEGASPTINPEYIQLPLDIDSIPHFTNEMLRYLAPSTPEENCTLDAEENVSYGSNTVGETGIPSGAASLTNWDELAIALNGDISSECLKELPVVNDICSTAMSKETAHSLLQAIEKLTESLAPTPTDDSALGGSTTVTPCHLPINLSPDSPKFEELKYETVDEIISMARGTKPDILYRAALQLKDFLAPLEVQLNLQGSVELTNTEYENLQAILAITPIRAEILTDIFPKDCITLTTSNLMTLKSLTTELETMSSNVTNSSTLQKNPSSLETVSWGNVVKDRLKNFLFTTTFSGQVEMQHLPKIRSIIEAVEAKTTPLYSKQEWASRTESPDDRSDLKQPCSSVEYLTTSDCLALTQLVHMRSQLTQLTEKNQKPDDLQLYYFAFLLNKMALRSQVSDTSTVRKRCASILITELHRVAECTDPIDPYTLERIGEQIDFHIDQSEEALVNEANEDKVSPETMATIVATLLWSTVNNGADTIRHQRLDEIIPLCDSLVDETDMSHLRRLRRSLSLLSPRALQTEVFNTLKSIQIHGDQTALHVLVQCLRVRELVSKLDLKTTDTLETNIQRLADAIAGGERVPLTLIQDLQFVLDKTKQLISKDHEQTINRGLSVLHDSMVNVNQREEEKAQPIPIGGDTPASAIDQSHSEMKEIGVMACEELADALSVALYTSHTPKSPVATVSLLVNQLRERASPISLSPRDIRVAETVLRNASIDEQQSHHVDTTIIPPRSLLPPIIALGSSRILEPYEAALLCDEVSIALNHSAIEMPLSEMKQSNLMEIRTKLLQSTLDESPIFVTALFDSLDSEQTKRTMATVLSQIIDMNKTSVINQVLDRLNVFRVDATEEKLTSSSSSDVPDNLQNLDPKTVGMLHQCLFRTLQSRDAQPQFSTMLSILTVMSDLEASRDITVCSKDLTSNQKQAHFSVDISPRDLNIVCEYLESVKLMNPVPQTSTIPPSLSEQVTALAYIQRIMDGEPLWPSEASLLLASLETLAAANDVARRQLLNDMDTVKQTLADYAFRQECEQEIYTGSGLDLATDVCRQLRSLHRICELSVIRKSVEFIGRQLDVGKHAPGSCQPELLHLCLMLLLRKNLLNQQEFLILNRLVASTFPEKVGEDAIILVKSLYDNASIFALHETETQSNVEPLSRSDQVDYKMPRTAIALIPDMVEQLLNDLDPEQAIQSDCALLISAMLHIQSLLHRQLGLEKLAARWDSHLTRLVWWVLYTTILGEPVKLDVRSRALICIACKHYRSSLMEVTFVKSEEILELTARDTRFDVKVIPRLKMADLLSLVLSNPRCYNLSPHKARLLADLTKSLYSPIDSNSDSTAAIDSSKIAQVMGIIQTIKETGEMSLTEKNRSAIDTVDLLMSFEIVQQFVDNEIGGERGVKNLDRMSSTLLSTALQMLLSNDSQQSQFQSWESDDYPTVSMQTRAVLGVTQLLLSSIVANPSETEGQELFFHDAEICQLHQLIDFWKPRLPLDAQRHRTEIIRQLSASMECDITADISTNDLIHAIQLAIVNRQVHQTPDSWICGRMLENLTENATGDYLNFPNKQRDNLRFILCPVRTVDNTFVGDATVLSAITYMDILLEAACHKDAGFDINQLANGASLATSLYSIIKYANNFNLESGAAIQRLCSIEQEQRFLTARLEQSSLDSEDVQPIKRIIEIVKTHLSDKTMEQMLHSLVVPENECRHKLLHLLRLAFLSSSVDTPESMIAVTYWLRQLSCSKPWSMNVTQMEELRDLFYSLSSKTTSISIEPNIDFIKSVLEELSTRLTTTETIPPDEALFIAVLFSHLSRVNPSVEWNTPEVALIRSALVYSAASGQDFSFHQLLTLDDFKHIIQQVHRGVASFIDQFSSTLTEWDTSSNARIELSIHLTQPDAQTDIRSLLLQPFKGLLPSIQQESLTTLERKLQRTAKVEQDSEDLSIQMTDSISSKNTPEQEGLSNISNANIDSIHQSHINNEVITVNEKMLSDLPREIQPFDRAGTKKRLTKLEPDPIVNIGCELLQSNPKIDSEYLHGGMHLGFQNDPCHELQAKFGHLVTLCNSRVLEVHNIVEVTTLVDSLHKATDGITPSLQGQTNFAPTERALLRDIQLAADQRRRYAMSLESADILQSLGHRLTLLALQSNQDLLRSAMRVWLSASVAKRFIFDKQEVEQLHSALSLAQHTFTNSTAAASDREWVTNTSTESLKMLEQVITRLNSTVESKMDLELNGPHSMGPTITEFLEKAQQAHEIFTVGSPLCNTNVSVQQLRHPDGSFRISIHQDAEINEKMNPRSLTAVTSEESGLQSLSKLDQVGVKNSRNASKQGVQLVHNGDTRLYNEECDQVSDTSQPGLSTPLITTVTEEQRRLDTWEKLVESRLSHACDRVESLLSMLPQNSNGFNDERGSVDLIGATSSLELNHLHTEVTQLKTQFSNLVKQFTTPGSSYSRERIEKQKLFNSQLSAHVTPPSLDHWGLDGSSTMSGSGDTARPFQSSECLRDGYLPSQRLHRSQFFPRHKPNHRVEPLEVVNLNGKPQDKTLSSLDRLHELIEIRRAVVAGSREELCRLGLYSSVPLKPIKKITVPTLSSASSSARQEEELDCPWFGEETVSENCGEINRAHLLQTMLNRQRERTHELISRSCYEYDQSTRLLDVLESRLTRIEHQVAPTDGDQEQQQQQQPLVTDAIRQTYE